MASNVLETPAGVTKTAIRTAARGGRLVFRRGEPTPPPDSASTEVRKQQAVLRLFEDRFWIASHLLRLDSSERRLKKQVASTADAMVGGGLVDEHTAVELRPVLPTDALRNPAMNARRETVLGLLNERFAHEYDVTAIPNTHPITPTEHEDSSPSVSATWGAISAELDGFTHQLGLGESGVPQNRLAMLAITGPQYVGRFFGGQILGHRDTQRELLVLTHVGVVPQENRLLGIS
jgi:hypothetical protein